MFSQVLIFRRKLVGSKIEDFQMKTLDPNFKGAVVGPLSEVIYANLKNFKKFTFRVLPEILFSVPVAMYFPKNHFLVNEINSKISILKSAGLIDWWTSKYLQGRKEPLTIVPAKLNIKHLAGGFYIFIGGFTIAVICFIIERFVKISRKWK